MLILINRFSDKLLLNLNFIYNNNNNNNNNKKFY